MAENKDWLQKELDRAKQRSQRLPKFARPVVTKPTIAATAARASRRTGIDSTSR